MNPIGDYVCKGDLIKINRYINQGGDINIYYEGFSLLYILVQKNYLSCVKEFLRCKANPNIKNTNTGLSPLHVAGYNDNIEMIKILLENGAEIDLEDNEGNTPICFCARFGNEKSIKFLKEKGADIYKRNKSKISPIETCIQYGHKKSMEIFLEFGYEINNISQGEMSLLGVATINNNIEIINYFVEKGADINLRDGLGYTPIFYSIIAESGYLLKYYLEKGVDINILCKDNNSLLYYSLQNKSDEIFNILIDRDINVNTYSNKGISPLYKACRNRDLIKIEKLLQKGAKIEANIRMTPLKLVIINDDYDILDLFINYGLDLNLEIGGVSLLVGAIKKKDIKLVRYLIKNGVNVNHIDSKNNIPIKVAVIDNDDVEILELILKNGFDSMAHQVIKIDLLLLSMNWNNLKKTEEFLNVFLKYGFRLEEKNERGQSLLFCMVYRLMFSRRNFNILKLLLDFGADIESVDYEGTTMLDEAISKSAYDVANFLIGNGANIERCDKKGNSYLMKLLSYEEEPENKSYIRLLNKLLKTRKLIEKKNANGDTPLIIATKENNIFCVQNLISIGANINHRNRKGRNALFEAVQNRNNSLISILLDSGINYKTLDKKGNTILHIACILGYDDCISRLLFEDIDSEILNKKKDSALDICIMYNKYKCAEIILDMSKTYIYEECRNSVDCIICFDSIEKGKEYKVCSVCKNLLHLPCLKSWLRTKDENKCMMCSTSKVFFHNLSK